MKKSINNQATLGKLENMCKDAHIQGIVIKGKAHIVIDNFIFKM